MFLCDNNVNMQKLSLNCHQMLTLGILPLKVLCQATLDRVRLPSSGVNMVYLVIVHNSVLYLFVDDVLYAMEEITTHSSSISSNVVR